MPSNKLDSQAKVILLGHSGMLGHAWHRVLKNSGALYQCYSYPEFDMTLTEAVDAMLSPNIDLVINCAAYTAVDQAESEIEASNRLNGHAVGFLAEKCKAHDITLIHYSTDYVFNGQADEPWPLDAPYEPVNQYGASKALGERLILDSGVDHLIIRTSWLYGAEGKNFIKTIHQASQNRDRLTVVNDQRGRPTWAEHLVKSSITLYQSGERGFFHVCDGGECTWYELAAQIVALNGANCQVNPCTSDQYPTAAKRPAYSVMDLSRAESITGPFPHWKDHLKLFMPSLVQAGPRS